MDFADCYPSVSHVDAAMAFLQTGSTSLYTEVNVFSSSTSSGSTSESSGSGCRYNILTEMLHVRENLKFRGMSSRQPKYEGTIEEVSLLDLWRVVQKAMKEFPKSYNLVSANCIQFCGQILKGLKDDLHMKQDKHDTVVKRLLGD